MRRNFPRLMCLTIPLAMCALGVAGFMVLKNETFVYEPQWSQGLPTVEEWTRKRTRAERNKVYVELGDIAGGGGSNNDAKLSIAILSSTLKDHPKATIFAVSWHYTVAMGTDSFELIYERRQRRLTFKESWRRSPSKVQRFSKVTDAMIHAAVAKGDSYANVNNYK